MKYIDEYLNDLFKDDKSKKTLELKLEMKAHLEESVKELINEGYNEEEASKNAIERFDGGTEMIKELHGMLNETKIKNTRLVKRIMNSFRNVSIFSLIIALLIMVISSNYWNTWESKGAVIGDFIDEIIISYDINDTDTYKKYIDKLLKSDELEGLISLDIYSNASSIKFKENMDDFYSDLNLEYKFDKNKNVSCYQGNGFSVRDNSDGNKIYYEYAIDSTEYQILDNIYMAVGGIGVISFMIYITLLIYSFYTKKKSYINFD